MILCLCGHYNVSHRDIVEWTSCLLCRYGACKKFRQDNLAYLEQKYNQKLSSVKKEIPSY